MLDSPVEPPASCVEAGREEGKLSQGSSGPVTWVPAAAGCTGWVGVVEEWANVLDEVVG